MFRFVVLALAVSSAYAGGYGHHGGLALGLKSGGYGGHSGYAKAVPVGPISAAIQSTRTYEVVPVALNFEAPVPQTIDVGPNIQPVEFIFRTQSSPMNFQQVHTPSAPQFENTKSEEEASVLTHETYKPVIQHFKETIQPHRNIEQRVLPVLENVHTVVAQGEQYRAAPVYAQKALVAPLPLLAKSNGY